MEHLLVESAIRATVVVICCALVLWATRIKAPTVLHGVWAGVVVAMLILPAWRLFGPDARVPLLPQRTPAATDPVVLPVIVGTSSGPANSALGTPSTPAAPAEQRSVDGWRAAALTTYGIVAFILFARLLSGTLRARRLVRLSSASAGHLTTAACACPVTVGWLRPVIILPETWREWPQQKLDAVLAHEREHARRRHPFVQWLALLNRALFWFHPVAWWLPRHLSALAEQTCDDAVLARGHDPGAYSQYLLETALMVRHGGRIRLAGVFMPGHQLASRIRRILTQDRPPALSRSRLTAVTAVCALACVAAVVATPVRALSQQPETGSRLVFRSMQPRAMAPDSSRPQPVSLEWLEGDEWAFEVQSIASSDELAAYGRLANARERDAFIERFWATRDPSPGTDANEFRDEYLRRVQFARSRFDASGGMGFNTDRGRVHLMFGPPDSIETEQTRIDRFEIWRYTSLGNLGEDVRFRFSLSRDQYCGFTIASPAVARTLGIVRLYFFGMTAISIPVDAKTVVGVRYDLRNRGGEEVDHGEIGFVDKATAANEPIGNHVPQEWFAAGFGCTHALPPDTYTVAAAVRLLNGEVVRQSVTFDVE